MRLILVETDEFGLRKIANVSKAYIQQRTVQQAHQGVEGGVVALVAASNLAKKNGILAA